MSHVGCRFQNARSINLTERQLFAKFQTSETENCLRDLASFPNVFCRHLFFFHLSVFIQSMGNMAAKWLQR